MTMLADVVDAVIGGDTHRDTHALEMVAPNGTTIAAVVVNNDASGFAAALAWISEHAPGPRVVVGLEGTRSYGIGLARAALAAGLVVVEIERPRRHQRRRGKSDPIDAHLAALQALRLEADRLPTPRADGDREALRILLGARQDLTTSKTRAVNRLRALLLSGTDTERMLARGVLTQSRLVALTEHHGDPRIREQVIRGSEIRRLAAVTRRTDHELAENKQQLTEVVADLAPDLLAKRGVGPISAAQVIVSWSHRGRCRNEAAFAALAGTNPIPASSGRVVRHRLNRGGDRQLNRALHNIMFTRWRVCADTHAYAARRRSEGKSDNEIRRCLKRYIARELYRCLTTT